MRNIDELLRSYQAGRRPPLDELVGPELLAILLSGIRGVTGTPLGILLPSAGDSDEDTGAWICPAWIRAPHPRTLYCLKLRRWVCSDNACVFDERCRQCEAEHAPVAAGQRRPLVCLCHAGLVLFLFPVVLDDQAMAILVTGLGQPAVGNTWSQEFIESYATPEKIFGIEDAFAESRRRNEVIMAEMDSLGGEPIPGLVSLAEEVPKIHPDDVPSILKDMEKASTHLVSLARRAVAYDLDAIRAYFALRLERLLPILDHNLFWAEFSRSLFELAHFCGFDYALLYMLRRTSDDRMYCYCFTALPRDVGTDHVPLTISKALLARHELAHCVGIVLKPAEAKEVLFRDKQLFDSPCYVVPMVANGPLGIAVMGCSGRKRLSITSATTGLLQSLSEDMSIILEGRRQMLANDIYVADIVHEIRSPLAAVLATTENIVAGRAGDVAYRASRIQTRLRRLQIAVERFMFLETLLSGSGSLKVASVSIYDVAMECAREYSHFAKEAQKGIAVGTGLAALPMLRTDREAFKHALANLLDNALKYADPGTDVVIEGRVAGAYMKVDVSDVGIPVPTDAIGMLGQRNFRTREAIKRVPTGTGIGMTVVKRFLKLAEGYLEVHSAPMSDRRPTRHHVVFSMYLPR
jgi:signal transduction histidine kinase